METLRLSIRRRPSRAEVTHSEIKESNRLVEYILEPRS